MKTLRTFIIMVVLIIGGMAMTGCEDSNATNNPESVTTNGQPESQTGEKPLDSSEKKQVLDSINVLVSQIESLSKSLEANANKLDEVKKEMSDLKGSSHLYDLISWGIAAIAFLTAIIALISFNSVKKRADRHRKEIEELKYKVNSFEQKAVSSSNPRARTSYTGLNGSEYNSLASRISLLERQFDKISQGKVSTPQNPVQVQPVSNISHPVNEQTGYFGLPTQMSLTEAYFKRLSDIRESDSRFRVNVRNDKAEFRPLEGTQYLNDLKSNDSIKMALDIQGCAPSEATQMRVILPGEAKKDGERWIITKKATIALSR